MDAEMIVRRADELGITLSLAGDRIRYAPRSRASEEFVDALREHKPEMLSYLRRKPDEADMPELLAWASHLGEQDLVLEDPVSYVEAEARTVTTSRVSSYAVHYLTTIAYARLQQQNGGWGMWTPRWWRERERESQRALSNLRQALDQTREAQP